MTSIPISRARNELTQIIHAVETGSPVELTRHGKVAAVLISADEYNDLLQKRTTFSLAFESFRTRFTKTHTEDDIFENIRSEAFGRDVTI